MRAFLCCLAVLVLLQPAGRASAQSVSDSDLTEVETLARQVLSRDFEKRERAIGQLVERGNTDAVPALIQALRFVQDSGGLLQGALVSLTGDQAGFGWDDWMLWQTTMDGHNTEVGLARRRRANRINPSQNHYWGN